MTPEQRAVIEAAKAWGQTPTGRGSADPRLMAEEELMEALDHLNATPEPTAAEEAEAVRRKLADPEVRAAYIAMTSPKRRDRLVSAASELIAKEDQGDG